MKANDQAVKERREAIAQRVLACFNFEIPNHRLLCHLDDEDWWTIRADHGIANRGFYVGVKRADWPWRTAPSYILEDVFPNGVPVFGDFVYLHGTTCSNDLGLAMTLAHELQHFVQRKDQRRLWAANTLTQFLSKASIKKLALMWCHLPHEREARIVSKRTAESLFGTEAVRRYVDSKIAERVTEADSHDWECIQSLATSVRYDLATETRLFFAQLVDYRPELQSALRQLQSKETDFADIDLDELLRGASA